MTDKPLIPAATIVLVRDAPTFQVLMVERHHQIDFASGALVFPGGKAAAEDSGRGWLDCCRGAADLDDVQRALQIAAVREAFEESGLLLARAGAQTEDFVRTESLTALLAQRAAIAAGEASFLHAVQANGLELALDRLIPFAHWITPKGMPKRFDTWFYLAIAPAEQIAVHDGGEAVDSVWIEPADAVAAAHDGRRRIIFPTRLNLELLAKSTSAQGALADARARPVVTVEPWIEQAEHGPELVIRPDAGYGAVREALGPNVP